MKGFVFTPVRDVTIDDLLDMPKRGISFVRSNYSLFLVNVSDKDLDLINSALRDVVGLLDNPIEVHVARMPGGVFDEE